MGGFLSIESIASGVTCLSMRFNPSTHLCLGECPGNQGNHRKGGRKRKLKAGQPSTMRAMPMSSGVELWGKTIALYLKFPHIKLNVFDIKLQEFFLLLRLDYTRQMSEEFLRFYHCKNTGFRTKVFHLGYSNATIEELSKQFKLSPTTLKRMFVEEFGLSPLKWMMQQRSRYVYNDIMQQEMKLQDIADRYGFSSVSYLCQFCRKQFGYTPQQIRKNYRLPAYE
ncbi:MAG: helix-turn-helix transcriptional regulator [Porphyromonadaceae bacterium]|nr:helix-turn-helix transcriptional regulator [Porphyromonadaceae bacterium]